MWTNVICISCSTPPMRSYETPEGEIAYVIKAFSTIVETGGAYREAFADPFYVTERHNSVSMTATTTEGAGNIYRII